MMLLGKKDRDSGVSRSMTARHLVAYRNPVDKVDVQLCPAIYIIANIVVRVNQEFVANLPGR